eukprot:gnl/TRDRNA2_/TRDRNA2_36147_c0_seq1.p1 gnl/TRDRNA2_/TRDRNA2_36147_c0~~gnl/TRDRNA2_/TRDRNA2_36147_c0_seq1.p1  ORF type:complete len:640 (+),score=173.21 gnl/TRDRNA2_/TRDRNA2_36147_c0_seq1:148-2067(+)
MTTPSFEDANKGCRELVDLSAENLAGLGIHLASISRIIEKNAGPPTARGERTLATQLNDKYDLYQEYLDDIKRRKAALELQVQEDFEKLRAWRKDAGTEGASLLEELQMLLDKCRQLEKDLRQEKENVEEQKQIVLDKIAIIEKKDRKWLKLSVAYNAEIEEKKMQVIRFAAISSFVQNTFAEVRFKFKSNEEAKNLMIEHHQNLRKARCQSRLDVIKRERSKRLIQICWIALQEELVENRHRRHEYELRKHFEDKELILNSQLSQALGDEEAAKALVAEQVRRMEEAREAQRKAEEDAAQSRKHARMMTEERDEARKERDEALEGRRIAEEKQAEAEAACRAAEAAEKEAQEQKAEAIIARDKAEEQARKTEEMLKKAYKKIESLKRMIAELGAESDSDGPPDKRPPPFFIDEETGSRIPRPRARKERMAMAYREAESARWELRLGMAAVVDKEVGNAQKLQELKEDLRNSENEVAQVRWANQVLEKDCDYHAAKAKDIEAQVANATQDAGRTLDTSAEAEPDAEPSQDPDPLFPPPKPWISAVGPPTMEPTSQVSFAPSVHSPGWSPAFPKFAAGGQSPSNTASPRFLTKVTSAPSLMPTLVGDDVIRKGKNAERIVLAPLRKPQKHPSSHWQPGWH